MSLTDLSRLNFNLERFHLAKKREISFYLFIKKKRRDKKRKFVLFLLMDGQLDFFLNKITYLFCW